MTDSKDESEAETKGRPAGEATDAGSETPAAKQVDSQDKTKDKPDSGQNEDG